MCCVCVCVFFFAYFHNHHHHHNNGCCTIEKVNRKIYFVNSSSAVSREYTKKKKGSR